MKWLHREIVLSQAYQPRWKGNDTNRLDEKNFSRAVVAACRPRSSSTPCSRRRPGRRTWRCCPRQPAWKSGRSARRGRGLARRAGDFASRVFGRAARHQLRRRVRRAEPVAVDLPPERPGGVRRHRPPRRVARRGTGASARACPRPPGRKRRSPPSPGGSESWAAEATEADKDKAVAGVERQIEERAGAGRGPARLAAAESIRPRRSRPRRPSARRTRARSVAARPRRAGPRRDHVRAAATGQGLRDLLWALLNTKEFVTNH
ncbi:MAG: hypothetical protein WKF75_01610 [Singulisphaera sp.]